MSKEFSVDEQLKRIKDLPFEEVLKLAQDVCEKANLKKNTPERWQIFSLVAHMGLMLKLDIRLRRLTSTIKRLEAQNQRLERASLKLAIVGIILASVTAFASLKQIKEVIEWGFSFFQNLFLAWSK